MLTLDDLTRAQRIALMNPCYFAVETAQPRYAHRLAHGSSLVLTVNTGYE